MEKELRIYKRPYGGILFNSDGSRYIYVNKNTLQKILKGEYHITSYRVNGFAEVAAIGWKITSYCPYNCVYCSQDRRNKAFFFNYPIFKKLNPFRVTITGGEPTSLGNFKDILKKLAEIASEITFTTSGYKLIDDVPKNISAIVSLDSHLEEINEKTRPSTYKDALNALEHYSNKKLLYGVNTVVTKYNSASLFEMGEFLESYNIKEWNISLIEPSGRGKHVVKTLGLGEKEFKRVLSALEKRFNFIQKNTHSQNMCIRYYGCWFPGMPPVLFMDEVGNITYCLEAYNHGIIENIRKIPVHVFNECKSCNERFFCGGGCRVSVLLHNRRNEFCKLYKGKTEMEFPEEINFNLPELEIVVKERYPELSAVLSLRTYIPELEEICYEVYHDLIFRKSDKLVKLLLSNLSYSQNADIIKDCSILWYVYVVIIIGLGDRICKINGFRDIKELIHNLRHHVRKELLKICEKDEISRKEELLFVEVIKTLSNTNFENITPDFLSTHDSKFRELNIV